MSVDINWEDFTSGPDGAALAETIRAFIDERFQAIPLPKLIRSVKAHGFEFGKVAPEIVLKDICDPLPDFYESDDDDDDENEHDLADAVAKRPGEQTVKPGSRLDAEAAKTRSSRNQEVTRAQAEIGGEGRFMHSNLSRGTTPGILGTTSNLGYFHLPLSAGLPGTQTPLAAFANAHFPGAHHQGIQSGHRHTDSFSSISPPPSATPTSSQEHPGQNRRPSSVLADDFDGTAEAPSVLQSRPEIGPEDVQIVFQVSYTGDVKLSLTADVFLDYPMPSFVGIPLKLKITGLTFNGVGILAYIKKRAHLCFLTPEDAEALVGNDAGLHSLDESGDASHEAFNPSKVGALLEDIRIESEMGETDSGKQVLKNMGKIEKFILEQVQRIFEDEFVYPSFWTFLV